MTQVRQGMDTFQGFIFSNKKDLLPLPLQLYIVKIQFFYWNHDVLKEKEKKTNLRH